MAKTVAMLVVVAAVVVMAAAVASASGGATADRCNGDPNPLDECLYAFVDGAPPDDLCCMDLSLNPGCLCKYANDPKYKKYLDSPFTNHTLATCGIAVPKC